MQYVPVMNSSEKKSSGNADRSATTTSNVNGPQLSPSTSRHLMMLLSDADLFSFGLPLWLSFDDNLEYDVDSENHHQSLPD